MHIIFTCDQVTIRLNIFQEKVIEAEMVVKEERATPPSCNVDPPSRNITCYSRLVAVVLLIHRIRRRGSRRRRSRTMRKWTMKTSWMHPLPAPKAGVCRLS